MRPLLAACRGFHTAALDLLYPPGCAVCDEPVARGACFCEVCDGTLLPLESACPRCALPRPDGGVCMACRATPPPFHEAGAAFAFGGAVADALRLLKFSARVDLGERLGRLLIPSVNAVLTRLDAVVVPVPLSMRRLRARGYNQAMLLALGAAPPSRVLSNALVRTRDTPAQVGRSAQARRLALAGAFRADARLLRGRPVVLVDDVMTTGATLAACAEAVLAAGVSHVVALTVGRALP